MRRVFSKHRSDSGSTKSTASMGSQSTTSSDASSEKATGVLGPFTVGVSSDCNRKYRKTMEDVHKVLVPYLGSPHGAYFAVFDGHAGLSCAQHCGARLHGMVGTEVRSAPTVPHALARAFRSMDTYLGTQNIRNAGSTAAVAVVRWEDAEGQPLAEPAEDGSTAPGAQRKLYVANVGDSRVVLSRGGQALRLSYDHRGSDPHERKRISNAGGIVMNNRVNGVLAVTRSLGDLYMKDLVLGDPYTTETVLLPEDDFVIIACDGLWDVCSDRQAVEIVRRVGDAQEASAALLRHALDAFSTDNITVMVIKLS